MFDIHKKLLISIAAAALTSFIVSCSDHSSSRTGTEREAKASQQAPTDSLEDSEASKEAPDGFDAVDAEAKKVQDALAKGQTSLENLHDAVSDGAIVEEVRLVADDAAKLGMVLLDERRAEDLERDKYRHPAETLAFFGIERTMTVVEALPGGGWYTRILLPYLHPKGNLIAISYPVDMYEQLYAQAGIEMTDERRDRITGFEDNFPKQAPKFGPEDSKIKAAIRFGSVDPSLHGTVDAVLYVRALHNLSRFEKLDLAVSDAHNLLKSGGVVGVVQHRAKEGAEAETSNGSKGYLKQSDVIKAFEKGGFVFEESAEFNANAKDSADHPNGVWNLPPVLRAEDKEKYSAIGESDRMTLRFRKP